MTASDDDMEIVRGSGNIYRDFGLPNADMRQFKALLASHIVSALDDRKLSVRQAQELTGYAAADFSRIRNVRLERFTIERLAAILEKLGEEVELTVHFRQTSTRPPPAAQLQPA